MEKEPLTVKLRNGVEVAAKLYKGKPMAMTYANLSQARAKANKLGPEWTVECYGRPFYVCKGLYPADPINVH